MPCLFLGHGSPMNAIEDNPTTRVWRALGTRLPRPRAIVCISAHWRTRGSAVTAMAQPRTIHDFGGFPPPLFAVQYPAQGSPAVAARVAELIGEGRVALDQTWGLDHGSWSVLVHLYPEADIPVVQLSLDVALDASGHYRLARALTALREEGVLIIGSGNVVHNLMRMDWTPGASPQAWATRFALWAKQRVMVGDHAALAAYHDQGEDARLAVPTDEHYLPLLYCLAQQQGDDRLEFANEEIIGGSISMLCVLIGI